MEIMAILNVHISGQERVVKCGKALVPSPLPVCSVTESRGTLGDPMDCSPPDSSVHGILQARILEWSGHFLLQGIFQTQGSNPRFLCLLNWQADSSLLASPGKPLSAFWCFSMKYDVYYWFWGFPCSSTEKESARNEGDPGSLTGPS